MAKFMGISARGETIEAESAEEFAQQLGEIMQAIADAKDDADSDFKRLFEDEPTGDKGEHAIEMARMLGGAIGELAALFEAQANELDELRLLVERLSVCVMHVVGIDVAGARRDWANSDGSLDDLIKVANKYTTEAFDGKTNA